MSSHTSAAAPSAGQRGYAVVDLETTGLKPEADRIIEIGVVLLDHTGRQESEWTTKVRQPLGRSIGAKDIHGLTWRSLRSGMSIEAALGHLSLLVHNRIMVAHNADFDTAFLRAESQRCGVALPIEGPLCTLQMSRTIHSKDNGSHQLQHRFRDDLVGSSATSRTSHKLGAVCERYGVPFSTSHRALADAQACASVLPHLLRDFGVVHAEPLLADDSPLARARRSVK